VGWVRIKDFLGWGAGEGAEPLPRPGLSGGVDGEAVSLPAFSGGLLVDFVGSA